MFLCSDKELSLNSKLISEFFPQDFECQAEQFSETTVD